MMEGAAEVLVPSDEGVVRFDDRAAAAQRSKAAAPHRFTNAVAGWACQPDNRPRKRSRYNDSVSQLQAPTTASESSLFPEQQLGGGGLAR
jgi:hypothetical protein